MSNQVRAAAQPGGAPPMLACASLQSATATPGVDAHMHIRDVARYDPMITFVNSQGTLRSGLKWPCPPSSA